ncbi:MAG: hypothetical protein Q9163_005430 [Psora crenata]
MDTLKDKANSLSESVQGAVAGTSKDANKHIAKDGNNPTSTRVTAAKDMVVDKKDQKVHQTNADLYDKKGELRQ